jgi:hypothetical protein
MTDAESLSGRFLVRMSFYNAGVVETEARAVWTGGREQIDGGLVYGVEFLGVSAKNTERLKTILHSPALLPVSAPKTEHSAFSQRNRHTI